MQIYYFLIRKSSNLVLGAIFKWSNLGNYLGITSEWGTRFLFCNPLISSCPDSFQPASGENKGWAPLFMEHEILIFAIHTAATK